MVLSSSSSANYVFDTAIFDGFRVLFNFAVVYGHVMYFMPIMLEKPEPPFVRSAEKEPLLSLLSIAMYFFTLYAVDVFLFISGYLFARSFCVRQPKTTLVAVYTWSYGFKHIGSRFLRLLPVYAIAWATGAALGSRPCLSAQLLFEVFHVLNCNPSFGKAPATTYICILVAWSLSTDVQAHAFMATVLVIFKSHKRVAQFLCFAVLFQILCRAQFLYQLGRPLGQSSSIVSVASSIDDLTHLASVLKLPVGNISFSEGLGDFNRQLLNDMRLYGSPYLRTAPAFIGFITWYAVDEGTAYVRFIERNVLLTLLGICSGTITLLFAFFIVPTLGWSPTWLCILHESVHRVAIAIIASALTVILGSPAIESRYRAIRAVRCLYTNWIVNGIANLSYSIYLMHTFVLWVATVIPPKITAKQFEVWRFVPSGVQVYLASILVAIPCHYFENRCHALRKRLISRKVPTSEKSTTKND